MNVWTTFKFSIYIVSAQWLICIVRNYPDNS